MMRSITLALMALALCTLPARGETVNRVAAVVNDEAITLRQLEQEMKAAPPGTPREVVLEQLIEERLLQQRAAEIGLTVTDEEVEEAIRDIQVQNRLTREQLVAALAAEGIDFDNYRANVRSQILRFKLLAREVQSRTDVTSQEIRDYFREHIDDFREPPFVRLNQVSVTLPERATSAQIEALRERAEEIATRLRAGEDFTLVLLSYATDAAVSGGDLGSFRAGELSDQFEGAVEGVAEGGVSRVVETSSAFVLLQVAERNPGSIRQYDSVKDEIARRLKERKTQERFEVWKDELRADAFIDIRL